MLFQLGSSGFHALNAGWRTPEGEYDNLGSYCRFWSGTVEDNDLGRVYTYSFGGYQGGTLMRSYAGKDWGIPAVASKMIEARKESGLSFDLIF